MTFRMTCEADILKQMTFDYLPTQISLATKHGRETGKTELMKIITSCEIFFVKCDI